jgi:hypothetical protein
MMGTRRDRVEGMHSPGSVHIECPGSSPRLLGGVYPTKLCAKLFFFFFRGIRGDFTSFFGVIFRGGEGGGSGGGWGGTL